jgi:outer membrane protein assembly factor BamB
MYLDAGDIYSLNANTGELYWQSETTIGADDWTHLPANGGIPRMAYSSGVLYVIRNDGSIMSLDAKTGQQLGVVEISPLPVYYDEETGHYPIINYTIAASAEYVAAYYSDSQELIVFERTDVEP